MQGKPPAALGGGAYVAGVAAAVLLLGESPDATVAAVAVGGSCLGIAAGGLLVTRTRLLGHRIAARFTGGALAGLGVWVTWTGVQSGAGGRYQFAIGSVFVAVVGWAVMVGGERTGGPAGDMETLAVLPRTTDGTSAGDGRRRQFTLLADVGVLVVVAYFWYRAAVRGDASSWLFGGLFMVVFLPGTRSQVRLTDSGLVTTRYVCWVVPFDQSRTPWARVYGYEATDEWLTIGTEFGADIVYDRERLDDAERVLGVLDDHVPRL
ncbi:hypothetical protein [Haloarcula laminariae]|uniref:hypothetical protein n=1 Tax=Haloarcula laminariae TaxID=2961577 RepID=UPI0021C5F356|nr:hypothetical protein [Halomicroarcula laminariae]